MSEFWMGFLNNIGENLYTAGFLCLWFSFLLMFGSMGWSLSKGNLFRAWFASREENYQRLNETYLSASKSKFFRIGVFLLYAAIVILITAAFVWK